MAKMLILLDFRDCWRDGVRDRWMIYLECCRNERISAFEVAGDTTSLLMHTIATSIQDVHSCSQLLLRDQARLNIPLAAVSYRYLGVPCRTTGQETGNVVYVRKSDKPLFENATAPRASSGHTHIVTGHKPPLPKKKRSEIRI